MLKKLKSSKAFIAKCGILGALLASPMTGHSATNTEILKERNETVEDRNDRMEWFRDAHFGMFVHWGLYAQYGGFWKGQEKKVNNCAEWMMLAARAPRQEYAAAAKDFNPKNYDAEAWVVAAKNAGMRYITITAKHHEGFAMFKSKASNYNIYDQGSFKRDPLKELADACKKHGLKLGFYYSQNLDWYHAGGGGNSWAPDHSATSDQYVDKIVIPQLREILTKYGEISVLWFDIPGGVINKARADRIQKVVLKCQPNIIINNRLGGGYKGDVETPEQWIPPMGLPGKDWESCMTMNKTWGFAKNDENWKSSQTMIRYLCDITSKGGNYLLNVGPNSLGEIPKPSLKRLAEVGEWMKVNKKAIYGTRASIFSSLPKWGRISTKYRKKTSVLYAMVFDSPANGKIQLPGLKNKILSAKILGSGKKLKVERNSSGPLVRLSKNEEKKKDYVIAIKVQGKAQIDNAAFPDSEGKFTLSPRTAKCTKNLKMAEQHAHGLHGGPEEHLAYWTNKNATATWTIKVPKKGKYQLKVRYAAPNNSAGSVIEFLSGTKVLPLTIESTGNWGKFRNGTPGVIELPQGESKLLVRVKSTKGLAPCNLGKIELIPFNK